MAQNHTRAGEALEQARKGVGLGQAAFAKTLGLSRSTYLRRITTGGLTGTEIVLAKRRWDLDLIDLIDA